MAAIEALGGRLIVMASRALARVAHGPGRLRARLRPRPAQVAQPVILHWLGDMFDPALAGYWGSARRRPRRWTTALGVIAANPGKVDGIKISLLDKDKEIAMRRRLPAGVRMYTGDDFNYAELIAGDGVGSAEPSPQRRAARHLRRDRAGGERRARRARRAATAARFHAILAPTVPLSRHIFQAPTRFYKTGIVFLAWLNGHQSHFTMVGGQQSARSLLHLAELFRLADAAGLLEQPELAATRMRAAAGAARRRRLMADARARLLGRPPLAVDQHRDAARRSGRSTRIIEACARHGIRAISPWRDQVAGDRPRAHRASCVRDARPRALAATAAAACSRRSTPPAASARSTTTGARSTRRAARRAVPGAGRRRPARRARRHGRDRRTSPARARRCATASRATLDYARERRHAAGDRAAASDVRRRPRLRQHAGAGARPLRRARPGRRWHRRPRARRRGRRLSRLVGSRSSRRRSRAPAGERLLAFHVCDWLVPTRDLLERPRHDGRRRDRHPAHPRLGRGRRASPATARSRSSRRENWWKRPADEVLATCIERHRSAV